MNFIEVSAKFFNENRKLAVFAAGTAVAVVGLTIGYKYIRKEKKLTKVGVISQLLVHPMKSGKAVSVETSECLRMGLKYGELQDRWVLVT